MNVTFYGVRGSTPCACDENRHYGGNTACVVVDAPGQIPVVLDLGTGLRFWGLTQPLDGSFAAAALVSHLHWDHIQGLPFFAPILKPGSRLDVYGPAQDDGRSLTEAFDAFMKPPYFPISLDQVPGDVTFTGVAHSTFSIGDVTVSSAPVPHVGNTVGYRIEHEGVSVAYISDHQQPGCGSTKVTPEVLALCAGVDLLIHDAQYDDGEFAQKFDWGHCTVSYAIEVAAQSGAQRLALFHHDPSHDDDWLDAAAQVAARAGARAGVPEVLVASEGLTVSLGDVVAR